MMSASKMPALASRGNTACLAPKRALVIWGGVVACLLILGLGKTVGSGPTRPPTLGGAAARGGAGDDARVVQGPTREVLVDSQRRHPAAVSLWRR